LLSYEASAEVPPEDRTTGDGIPERAPLLPLPAMRRRRGLTSIAGGLPFLLGCLELAKDGVSRDDLRTHIKTENPRLKDSSLGTVIYTLQYELGVLRRSGDTLR
jgi:5-methylcytosine-specific restriction enzyme B